MGRGKGVFRVTCLLQSNGVPWQQKKERVMSSRTILYSEQQVLCNQREMSTTGLHVLLVSALIRAISERRKGEEGGGGASMHRSLT